MEHPLARIYLRILRSGLVSAETRRTETRTGVKLAEIADKNMKTALTACLIKFDIPVSFLISPGTCRMHDQRLSAEYPENQFDYIIFITIKNNEYYVIR
jgi:hypothetical protein